ncbi:M48 family metalloprotease [Thermodesulfobacteriota bacterium B35]
MAASAGARRLAVWLLLFFQLLQPLQAAAMSIGEERKIGEKLLYSVRAELKILDDPDISQYINDLGAQVVAVAGIQYFDYHFFVVRSDQFNAFAAPAGLVFFYSGLIARMKSEDELLSVMAHEIGHVVSRHIAQRMEKGGKISAATMLLGIASLAIGIPALSQGLLAGSMAAGQAINLSYSRQDEEQADRLSFEWMRKMHRNPVAMEGMLRVMRRISRYRSDKLPQYLLTHPNPEARLNYVESLVEMDPDQKVPGYYRKHDNFSFLRFRYRVMVQSVDLDQLRISCRNTIERARDREARIMAHYGLALVLAAEHDLKGARRELATVRDAYPDRDILAVDAGVMGLEAGQLDQALELLRFAHRRLPGSMYATFELARALEKKGDLDGAETLLEQVARHMPEYSRLYFELGKIKAAQGADSLSRFYLGKYYLYQGRLDLARQYLGRAAKDKTIAGKYRDEAAAIIARLDELKNL